MERLPVEARLRVAVAVRAFGIDANDADVRPGRNRGLSLGPGGVRARLDATESSARMAHFGEAIVPAGTGAPRPPLTGAPARVHTGKERGAGQLARVCEAARID